MTDDTSREDSPAGPVLLLRTCRPDGASSHGFVWPFTIGAEVVAPDWNPDPVCGGGLHGLPWGEGDGTLLDWSDDAVWLVVEADEVVRVDHAKAKVPRCIVRFVGTRFDATAFLIANGARGRAVVGGTSTSGDRGTSTSGNDGTSMSGDRGTSTSGDRGTSTSGNDGTSMSGHRGTSMSGHRGTSMSGDRGTSMSGHRGTSMSGHRGTSMSGPGGTLVFHRWDGSRDRLVVAYVGEDGILADTAYRLDDTGRVVQA